MFGRMLLIIAIGLAMILGFGSTKAGQSTPGGADVHRLDLPVQLAYCQQDPGNKLQPGGGRFSPEQIMKEFDCTPADGVSVTVSSDEIDFFARCETGDDGVCRINAPTDPERELVVAVHMATVAPGFSPHEVANTTIHFSEFTGIGIPLLPDQEVTPANGEADSGRTTLAVNVAECEDGSNAEGCERSPVEVLLQASAGDVSAEGAPWLATNDEGWVSFDRGFLEGETIDLMLKTDTQPRFACTDVDSGDRIATAWIEGHEGNFIRVTPVSDGDITCDVTLLHP